MKRHFLLYAVAALVAKPAFGQLDRPVTPSQITVGSEIKRGADAAQRCAALSRMPMQYAAFSACIDRAQAVNRQQQGSNFEPFDLGLYHGAVEQEGIAAQVMKGTTYSNEADVLAATVEVHRLKARAAQDSLNLSDQDVARAVILGK